jgi:hypothetical protein
MFLICSDFLSGKCFVFVLILFRKMFCSDFLSGKCFVVLIFFPENVFNFYIVKIENAPGIIKNDSKNDGFFCGREEPKKGTLLANI